MAVSTASARDHAEAASRAVDLRHDLAVASGTFEWDGPEVSTGWHRHPYHQLEYAFRGVAEVETPAGRYLVPPQQAIWIPAGLPHVTTLREVHSISLFLHPDVAAAPDDRARVLAAAPMVREMLLHGRRWPIGRLGTDPTADRYFAALTDLVLDWLEQEVPLHLPTSSHPLVRRILEVTDADLAGASATAVARAVGVSPRTMRRLVAEHLGLPWQSYVVQSRLQRAAGQLAGTDATVLEVATAVGFENPSSFARAFKQWIGETPSAYQRRVSGGRAPAPRGGRR